jgi:hypothetical protein
LAAVLFAAACGRPKPPPANPPRIQDSPPEQAAALNAAARLELPAEEERWGVEPAKERKRQADEKKAEGASKTAVIPMPPPNGAASSADAGSTK